jgi:hypothetical protein
LALAQVEEAKTFFGANVTKGGLGWESGFWVNNLNDDPVELTYFFAKNGVNAARVTTTKKTILSGAREFIRPVPLGQAGMVGLLSDEQLHYRGILGIVDGVSPSDSDADDYDELTIVDSSMAYFGGEIADVEAPDGLTHLVVTNFSSSRNSCVAAGSDSFNELCVLCGCLSNHEEGTLSVMFLEHLQDSRCTVGMRAVIEGHRHQRFRARSVGHGAERSHRDADEASHERSRPGVLFHAGESLGVWSIRR